MTITFFVAGIPRPGGSKTARLVCRKGGAPVMVNGRPLITTRDAGGELTKNWRSIVAHSAAAAYQGSPLCGALEVQFHFVMPRPRGHFGSGKNAGKVKAAAPTFHTVKPDVLKLSRSTEDALTGIIWRDDSITSRLTAEKVYGDRPGCRVTVTELEPVEPAASERATELFAEATA